MNITQQQKKRRRRRIMERTDPQHERVQNPDAVRPVTYQRKSTDRHSHQPYDLRHTLQPLYSHTSGS